MAKYVDGFVLVIPKDKVEKYKKMAEEGRDAWMKHGALSYFECIGDDLAPKEMGGMEQLGFKALAKAESNETIWFSFITYNSKEERDEITKKVMDEMGEKYKDMTDFEMPFDMNRMAMGGFNVEVEG
jgi:uncharacterized protein YbaA (DUF1428 family)